MRRFAEEFRDEAIVKQLVSQLPNHLKGMRPAGIEMTYKFLYGVFEAGRVRRIVAPRDMLS